MAISRCPRGECDGTHFEMKKLAVQGTDFKLNAIQCTKCGAVAGVMEHYYLGVLVRGLARKLGVDPDSPDFPVP